MTKQTRSVVDDLRAGIQALEQRLTAAQDALRNFVLQVDEFTAGDWDEADWPAAFDSLTQLAEAGRKALGEATP